jgi:hypothetical protein
LLLLLLLDLGNRIPAAFDAVSSFVAAVVELLVAASFAGVSVVAN